MSPTVPLGITGVTGAIGGRVAARIADRGLPQRLVVRDPSRAPDQPGAEIAQASYDDADAMRAAFAGVGTLFLVSAKEQQDRLRVHLNAVDAAVAAGVGRIVYLSFLAAAPDATFTFARDHFHTEAHIRDTGVPFTFLRSSLYLDYMPWMCGDDGVIRGPAGTGHFVPVTRDDIADVAVAVLSGTGHDGLTYDMTGPDRLTMSEVAQELARATGRSIAFHNETLEEARASRAHYGAPDWEVEGWVSTYAAIAQGELDVASDAVERVAGHPPQTFRDYLAAHPESYERLRADAR
jgi:NAD(P)H dehydrogenase (quinone)